MIEYRSVEVEVTQGRLRGSAHQGVTTFFGVPFAAAPVGELRWRPPHPAKGWHGVRDATVMQERCAQNADLSLFATAGGIEDCLYLNVYASEDAVDAAGGLPVLVWIHGGSLFVGSANDYDGTKLARDGRAIVVTINYRLGLFGFFAHPELMKNGEPAGNFGIMDQQAALSWVRRNIASFGGDPANVTLCGESSGGACVLVHAFAPDSAGLFQYGISMSGSALVLREPAFGAPKSLDGAAELGLAFAAATGCHGGMDDLRALSTATILEHQFPYLHNQPVIDGLTLLAHPGDLFRDRQPNCSRLINGVTRNEGTFFAALAEIARGAPMSDEDLAAAIGAYYGQDLADRVAAEYHPSRFPTPSHAYSSAVTSSLFACTAHFTNQLLCDKVELYAYEFADATAPSYVGRHSFDLEASHTFELSYIFEGFNGAGVHELELDDAQERLSQRIIHYWTHLNTAGDGAWDWPPFQRDDQRVMVFGDEIDVVHGDEYARTHNVAFWDETVLYAPEAVTRNA